MNDIKPENKAYKVTLILLVGLAAFSTAIKDLNRLQEMVGSLQEFTSQRPGTEVAMLDVDTIPRSESCPSDSQQLISPSAESGESDGNARDPDDESGIDYEIVTEPEVGGGVELAGSRKAKRYMPHPAIAKYAPESNLKEGISAKRRGANWPAHFEFKTSDGTVTLDLPMTMLTHIKEDALETEVSPEYSLILLDRINRKHLHRKTDSGRREVMIKRFERSYGSRRAS